MFHSAFSRGIRKITCSVDLKCTALYFHKVTFTGSLHIKIYSGIAVLIFRNDLIVILLFKPFLYNMVWCLALDIEKNAVFLSDCHQIKSGFPSRCARFRKPYFTARYKEFTASARILHMYGFFSSVYLNFSYKSVWSFQK